MPSPPSQAESLQYRFRSSETTYSIEEVTIIQPAQTGWNAEWQGAVLEEAAA